MNNNNKTMWWVLGAIVVIVIIALAVRSHNKVKEAAQVPADTSTTVDATEDVTEGSVDAPVTTGVAPVTLSYANALKVYEKARFQFDATCHATPVAETFKNGTNIMLDNRSGVSRTFHLGYLGNISIKAWGFKIVKVTGSPLPSTILVDCGGGQNVATITVQK